MFVAREVEFTHDRAAENAVHIDVVHDLAARQRISPLEERLICAHKRVGTVEDDDAVRVFRRSLQPVEVIGKNKTVAVRVTFFDENALVKKIIRAELYVLYGKAVKRTRRIGRDLPEHISLPPEKLGNRLFLCVFTDILIGIKLFKRIPERRPPVFELILGNKETACKLVQQRRYVLDKQSRLFLYLRDGMRPLFLKEFQHHRLVERHFVLRFHICGSAKLLILPQNVADAASAVSSFDQPAFVAQFVVERKIVKRRAVLKLGRTARVNPVGRRDRSHVFQQLIVFILTCRRGEVLALKRQRSRIKHRYPSFRKRRTRFIRPDGTHGNAETRRKL